MASMWNLEVTLHSGEKVRFDGLEFGRAHLLECDGVRLRVEEGHPAPVTVTPPAGDRLKSIEYTLISDIRNYRHPIVPDSGRMFIWQPHMVMFWRLNSESCINDVKTPLYMFTGQDMNMGMAFGVIGRNYETAFKILEPRHNRALIVYMRRLSFTIKRGTDLYPIPEDIVGANADGSVTEHLYYRTSHDAPGQPWPLTLRDFCEHQKRIFNIPDVSSEAALAPLWCSWTDWHSNDVTDEVVRRQVQAGVKLGIRNYIVDDGWFGPGLDNEWDVPLNIGDWEPDPGRFPDMKQLVKDIRQLGGVPMVWCAPHGVAEGANCFAQRRPWLIKDDKGALVKTGNGFHSLCFQSPEGRRIMGDIVVDLIRKWDFDGAKYDLFNSVPQVRCCNDEHTHDVSSMVEGLELTLKEMSERCLAIKPDYIVELKQNYGTPFLAQYGSMTRAGDTPYNPEGNFLRTVHVQAYSPFSINDYQTVTSADSPEDAACVVIKMIAVGIPTYSIDFDRLCAANKRVIAHYNKWYNRNVRFFMKYRIPLDGDLNRFKLETPKQDFFFLVNNGGPLEISRASVILNGTGQRDLFVRSPKRTVAEVTQWDCQGRKVDTREVVLCDWTHVEMLPGGRMAIVLR